MVGKTAWGTPPAAQISVYSVERGVDQGTDRGRVPDRGDAADRLAGVLRTNSGVARLSCGQAERGGELRGVDPVRARGEHQQRGAVRVEDQRVGDLADLDAEGGGRRGGGVHRLGQDPDLDRLTGAVPRVRPVEHVLHRLHVGMKLHALILPSARRTPTASPLPYGRLAAGADGDRD